MFDPLAIIFGVAFLYACLRGESERKNRSCISDTCDDFNQDDANLNESNTFRRQAGDPKEIPYNK